MQISHDFFIPVDTDGTASSFTLSVSDASLFDVGGTSQPPPNSASGMDFSPVDAVSPTCGLQPTQAGAPGFGGQLALNSKGTIVTATFATPPPALPNGFRYLLVFTVHRNI